jgi:phosphoglycolate phosphatase
VSDLAAIAPRESAVRMFDVSAIAFDLDGTLLDTVRDLAAAVNATLAESEYPPLPIETVRNLVGKGMPNLVRRALALADGVPAEAVDDADVASALVRYQAHYAALLGRETQPYPGLAAALQRLRAMGFALAIVTNKAHRFVQPHLELAGIAHHFDLTVGGDTLPTKKPGPGPLLHVAAAFDIRPERLLMVGDSANDALAARAAGCPVLVVPHGYSEGVPVQSLDVDGIVPSLEAVVDRVRYVEPG